MHKKLIWQVVHVSAQRPFSCILLLGKHPHPLWSMMESCSCVACFQRNDENKAIVTSSIRHSRNQVFLIKVLRFIIAKLIDF